MKRIGVLVSGGDAPGINAALSGIYQTAARRRVSTVILQGGLDGLIDGDATDPPAALAAGTALHDGSLVASGRSRRFHDPQQRATAVERVQQLELDALITIGGDGTATATALLAEAGIQCLTLPLTIDNDIVGTDLALGFQTGVQKIASLLDDIVQTAATYRGRVFYVETMGGPTGHLVLHGGLAGGADLILLPEHDVSPSDVATSVHDRMRDGAPWIIIAASEGIGGGYQPGRQNIATDYCTAVEEQTGIRPRITVMGYYTRGSRAVANDIELGLRFGSHAVISLLDGATGHLVGCCAETLTLTPLAAVSGKKKPLHTGQLELARSLDRLVPAGRHPNATTPQLRKALSA